MELYILLIGNQLAVSSETVLGKRERVLCFFSCPLGKLMTTVWAFLTVKPVQEGFSVCTENAN